MRLLWGKIAQCVGTSFAVLGAGMTSSTTNHSHFAFSGTVQASRAGSRSAARHLQPVVGCGAHPGAASGGPTASNNWPSSLLHQSRTHAAADREDAEGEPTYIAVAAADICFGRGSLRNTVAVAI